LASVTGSESAPEDSSPRARMVKRVKRVLFMVTRVELSFEPVVVVVVLGGKERKGKERKEKERKGSWNEPSG